MRSLKTAVILLSAAIATATSAQSEVDLRREFANCAGRYSAIMEHAWLMRDTKAETYEAHRDEFISLLDAIGEQNETTLHLRVDAKLAMSALLAQATFAGDPVASGRARHFVKTKIEDCRAMLLGG